jgi:ribosomal RNA-processing protein 12
MPTEVDLLKAFDSIIGEILICQKDANKRARESALEIMRTMSRAVTVSDLFTRLINASLSEISMIRSSAIISICMLLLERREESELHQLIIDGFPNILKFLGEQIPEQTRAVLSLIRVCIAILPVSLLEPALPQFIFGFTEGLADERVKYLSRCRAIMRKLVHRVDEEVIRSLLPPSELPLLAYILKMNRRGKRRAADKKKDRLVRMLESDSDDDSDDEEELTTAVNAKSSKKKDVRPVATRTNELLASFPSSLDDLLQDRPAVFMPTKSTTSVSKKKSTLFSANAAVEEEATKENAADEKELYTLEVTDEGKLVLKEKPTTADVAPTPIVPAEATTTAQSKANDSNVKKRAREPGEEYRSKKAGGDVWKKGMLQPHAYIPLDPRLLSKGNKDEAVKTFGSVVKLKKRKPAVAAAAAAGRKQGAIGNRNQRKAVKSHLNVKIDAKKKQKI